MVNQDWQTKAQVEVFVILWICLDTIPKQSPTTPTILRIRQTLFHETTPAEIELSPKIPTENRPPQKTVLRDLKGHERSRARRQLSCLWEKLSCLLLRCLRCKRNKFLFLSSSFSCDVSFLIFGISHIFHKEISIFRIILFHSLLRFPPFRSFSLLHFSRDLMVLIIISCFCFFLLLLLHLLSYKI